MNKNEIISIIEKLASSLKSIKTTKVDAINDIPADIPQMDFWDWPQGVALFGMYLYYKETGDREILAYLKDWFKRNIEQGLPVKNINTMCPMLTLTYLYEETKDKAHLKLLKEWLDYAMNELPRTEEGAFQHITAGGPNEGQLWDDTLYMTVLFVTRMGVILKEEKYIDESIRQFMVHLKYLTDVKTGLFFHGWTFIEKNHFANALWGRGNSWYTAGLVDYLDMADLPDGVRLYLISSFERQVRALKELQAENGMWHTLLDDKNSYVEASATAAFAYGILKAVRKGYISKEYEETGLKALNAIASHIDENGVLNQVSMGTGMGEDLDYYRTIPICPQLYGQSMAILLFAEYLKHFK